MAAELEKHFDETAELIQSSGGVFEVEDNGALIFSKKSTGRFPQDKEVQEIVADMANGMSLQSAQARAAERAPSVPSFLDWLHSFLTRQSKLGRK